ncbi:MAG TPA: ferritin-like domain-containing protein [Kofleriaceae bacterium]|nr:ferritin-like domain-containing protein [Kofleriaceae bacterium]
MRIIPTSSTKEMLEGVAEFGPTTRGDASGIARTRVAYAKARVPVGTMPPTEQSAAIEAALDKLGARLQFERSGTRLYEALISKVDAYGTFAGGPSRDELQDIRNEEHHHALLAQEIIESLGGDPRILTPCANLQATASRGLCDVLTDPRTSLVEGLDAIIVAELVDRESWEQLVASLQVASVRDDLMSQVREALTTEEEHLRLVRVWITAARAARAGANT